MNTRIHTKSITAIAAAAMIAVAVAPSASADSANGTRIQIPPALSHLHEPGSTGWVPQSAYARADTTPATPSNFRAPGSTGFLPQSSSAPSVDPLAVGYLIGQGLSPSEVTSWTTGACSHQVKASSCYAMFRPAAVPKPVDPLAVGYLIGKGLAPSEVRAWTTGICSHRIKAPSCFAMFRSPVTNVAQITESVEFQWGDAAIGAGVALGLALATVGALTAVRKRRTVAHA